MANCVFLWFKVGVSGRLVGKVICKYVLSYFLFGYNKTIMNFKI